MDANDNAWAGFRWINEPPAAKFVGSALDVTTGNATDFWQKTFYGFERDSGHVFARPVEDDFTLEARILGRYETLYDQAGIMVRADATHWVKAGIEYSDGQTFLSVVVTNGFSDWSLRPVTIPDDGIVIRLTRHAEAIRVQFHDDAIGLWQPLRLAYLDAGASVQAGIMCCSPERAGFEVRFTDVSIGPPIDRRLHD
jgi:regulation of enolase protein 1 (concanavalin A-like superfamily)